MKYEYKQVLIDPWKQEAAEEQLNELGRDGWEMVDVANIGGTHYLVYAFKRQLRSEF
ncbi:MAG: DUF4177 domain-containing protein [Defluviitaleaceae bacterium]|nr:DUF4177 domain-containing protein [Defluviitaleaceae bacterium]